MRSSDPHATVSDSLIRDGLEHGLAPPLVNTHFLSRTQAKAAECRGIHAGGGLNSIARTLQGWRAACDRIGEVNRHIGNTFKGS